MDSEFPVIELTEEQKSVLETVLQGTGNILIMGKAGTGKSFLLHHIKDALDTAGKKGFLTAPTGVAAIKIGGETLHKVIHFLRTCGRNLNKRPDYIIIDEVSMVRADLFDELETVLWGCGFKNELFGGTRVIAFGDFGQLPPVVERGSAEEEYIKDNYFSEYVFSSAAYAMSEWKVVQLTHIFRQKDENYTKLLNNVREGKVTNTIKYLNEYHVTDEPKGVFLTSTNKAADEVNAICLNQLDTELVNFPCTAFGKILPHEYPAPENLGVKVGARVMVIRNIRDLEFNRLELINGDVGTVAEIRPDEILMVCDRTQREHTISRTSWDQTQSKYDPKTKELYTEVVASFTQFPLRLAWAITIHKSQGATIHELTIDLRRPLFAAGQLYVALSRGTSLEGLHIIGNVRPRDAIVCPVAAAFMKDLQSGVGVKPGSKFEKFLERRAAKMGIVQPQQQGNL